MDLDPALRAMVGQQRGVVTRAQLATYGVGPDGVRWRVGRSWRMLLPGVVLLSPRLPDDHQRRVAALLYAGPSLWLAGSTATAPHGLTDGRAAERVYVFVPPPLSPRDVSWVSIRRTHLVDERVVERGPLRYSCLARAVVDAAARLPEDEARALVIRAVQEHRVRLDDVSHWVEARRPNGRVLLRGAVTEAASGAWSVPEADLATVLRTSRVLPPVWLNPELYDMDHRRLTTPDIWIDDVGMAVMVHSREFHGGVLSWDATVEADSDLAELRVVVLGVTPTAIARRPDDVLRRVEQAYLKARASGTRAPVIAAPRQVRVTQIGDMTDDMTGGRLA